jgi:16S rRNA processing protein RimM
MRDGYWESLAGFRHQHRWRVRFDGYGSREEAEALRGLTLRAEPIDDPDTWFIHQLIGASVLTMDNAAVGTAVAVIDNPVHDLLELDTGALVPLPFVVDVDTSVQPARVRIDPPDGLLDLVEG